ncbi:hypothetical protein [Paraburkholderia sp. BL10I2N1]|uniref:hypothetical protein n=1 Tax=Paraburkholderia sp. BL10I2N1 TaxID=1938796 RepID=UPI00105E20B1|nr:hypothetical protein [Paraburkholderia sp. BL10I2N1]TDN67163.1 hypothetical protein B0G77_0409 [Paraburkholderia sp. BL10I2N1]
MTETSSGSVADQDAAIHVIELTERDVPLPGAATVGRNDQGRGSAGKLDGTALDAVAVRRSREFDAARARPRERAGRDDAWQAHAREPGAAAVPDTPDADTATGPQARGPGYTHEGGSGARVEPDTTTSRADPAAPGMQEAGARPARTLPVAAVDSPAGKRAKADPPERTQTRPAGNREDDAPRYTGELIGHGGAPYQHNPARSASHYVVFRDHAGIDHVVRGVDLERAIAQSGAQAGQVITLENPGRRWATIESPVFDATGTVMRQEEKEGYRNTWQVQVLQPQRTTQPHESPNESPHESPHESPPRPDRQPAIEVPGGALSQDRSAALTDEERVLHLAVVAAAMREQGFSERSVARVRACAARMLDTFRAEGVAVPAPKVYDPKAPSTRTRRVRSSPDRAASRELDRPALGQSLPGL